MYINPNCGCKIVPKWSGNGERIVGNALQHCEACTKAHEIAAELMKCRVLGAETLEALSLIMEQRDALALRVNEAEHALAQVYEQRDLASQDRDVLRAERDAADIFRMRSVDLAGNAAPESNLDYNLSADLIGCMQERDALRKVNQQMLEALLVVQRSVPTIYFSTSCKCVPAAIAAATAQEKA